MSTSISSILGHFLQTDAPIMDSLFAAEQYESRQEILGSSSGQGDGLAFSGKSSFGVSLPDYPHTGSFIPSSTGFLPFN